MKHARFLALPSLLVLSWLQAGCGSLGDPALPLEQTGPAFHGTTGPALKAQWIESSLRELQFTGGRVSVALQASGNVVEPQDGALFASRIQEGESQRAAGRHYEALEAFAAAVRAAPERPEAYLGLGWALRRVKRPADAEAAWRTALDLDPRSTTARASLASLLASQQRRDEAIDLYRDLLVAEPQNGETHARLAVQLYYAGDSAGAELHAELAQENGGRLPDAFLPLLKSRQQGGSQGEGGGEAGGGPSRSTQPSRAALGPETRVDSGGTAQAAETAIAGAGQDLVAAWNDQRAGQVSGSWRLGVGLSSDGGSSWTEQIIRAPGGEVDDFEGDPMVAYDPRTGNFWAGGVSFFVGGSVYVARKRPGQGFDATVVVTDEQGLLFDKPLMAVGPAPGNPNSTRLYIAYREGFHRSTDLGQTWSAAVPLTPTEVYYQPRVAPDGTVYILSWDMDSLEIRLRRSVDGGVSFQPRQQILTRMDVWGLQESTRVPGEARAVPLPTLAIAPDGDLYVLFCDTTGVSNGNADLDLYLSRSTDGGSTWSTPQAIHGPTGADGDQFAPWLEVDGQGRLHAVFYDTRYQPQDDTDTFAQIDVTYAFSPDGGATWRETRITDQSSSTEDAFWIANPNSPPYQFLGDYLGLTVDTQGEAVVVYAAAPNGDFNIYTRRVAPAAPLIFQDGFETGSASAWSAAVGDAPGGLLIP